MRFSSTGDYIVKVRNGGRDNKNPTIYLPPSLCTKWQIQEGDRVIIRDSSTGIEIIPYIPFACLENKNQIE